MEKFFTISKDDLRVELCRPSASEGYYRGTRFDWAGVFRRITRGSAVYADEWFDRDEPYRHDNVCGLSEEFVILENGAAGEFVKIGVGRLVKGEGAYDRFKLYDIVDGGERTLDIGADRAAFGHRLDGAYDYEKRVVLRDRDTIVLEHRLRNLSTEPIRSYVYNHNFFTFNRLPIDRALRIDFPSAPRGTWRDVMSQVGFEGNGIRFRAPLEAGGLCPFVGDLTLAVQAEPFGFRIANVDAGLYAVVKVCAPVDYSVFWSNPRVSCVEPYTPLNIAPGGEYSWSIEYTLGENATE